MMTRIQLLDRLVVMNKNFKNHSAIQRWVVTRYTVLALAYLYPKRVKGKFNMLLNIFYLIGLTVKNANTHDTLTKETNHDNENPS